MAGTSRTSPRIGPSILSYSGLFDVIVSDIICNLMVSSAYNSDSFHVYDALSRIVHLRVLDLRRHK